jgi:predicted DNA-binding protein
MAKCIKLTDEVYQNLRDLARADGETIAGEIRKIIALRKSIDEVSVLEQIASKLGKVVKNLG